MQAEHTTKQAAAIVVDPGPFVAVAIPDNVDQSINLKTDLEAYDIPVLLGQETVEMDAEQLGGIPVLVPECHFEQASEIVGHIELNAVDDVDDDFDLDDDEDDLDIDDDDDLDDWDDDDLGLDDEDDFDDEE